MSGIRLVGNIDELLHRLRVEIIDDSVIVLRTPLCLAGNNVEELDCPVRAGRRPA